jgi:hypothetical protein
MEGFVVVLPLSFFFFHEVPGSVVLLNLLLSLALVQGMAFYSVALAVVRFGPYCRCVPVTREPKPLCFHESENLFTYPRHAGSDQ